MAVIAPVLALSVFFLAFPADRAGAAAPPSLNSPDTAFHSETTMPASSHVARDPFRPLLSSTQASVGPMASHIAAVAMPATATVPIVNLGRLMIVEAQLNGVRTVRLVVDTGASYTVLFPEVMREMGLLPQPNDGNLSLWTAGGEVGAQIVTLQTIQVGTASVGNLPVAVLGLRNPPEGIDGLLGLSFLNHFVVTLDSRMSQLRLKRHQ